MNFAWLTILRNPLNSCHIQCLFVDPHNGDASIACRSWWAVLPRSSTEKNGNGRLQSWMTACDTTSGRRWRRRQKQNENRIKLRFCRSGDVRLENCSELRTATVSRVQYNTPVCDERWHARSEKRIPENARLTFYPKGTVWHATRWWLNPASYYVLYAISSTKWDPIAGVHMLHSRGTKLIRISR